MHSIYTLNPRDYHYYDVNLPGIGVHDQKVGFSRDSQAIPHGNSRKTTD